MELIDRYRTAVRQASLVNRMGEITQLYGLLVEATGPDAFLGEVCEIYSRSRGSKVSAEVVALKNGKVVLMPHDDIKGVSLGSEVAATGNALEVGVGPQLLGRVIDAFGKPLDDRPAPKCDQSYPLHGKNINPLARTRVTEIFETGVSVIDSMLTLGQGQRVGIFAGSGVGKSSLLGMIAKYSVADVNVIAMVGERGREVLDFLHSCLGLDGLAKSIVVVATSDEPALKRTHAALAATAIAEYFRDQGKNVLLTMDSLTRYAMALREIGLAIGEPPTSRGYTPSVFAALPKLLERTGAVKGKGSITAIYTVLVEGDDLNDPIADTTRAILDGHIVLSRQKANKNEYPAIDVLTSISRLLGELASPGDMITINRAITHLSVYRDSEDMIELGAYRAGTNPKIDAAMSVVPQITDLFNQPLSRPRTREQTYDTLSKIIDS